MSTNKEAFDFDSNPQAGLNLMEEYRKKNKNFSITSDQLSHIQYEHQQLRKGGSDVPEAHGRFDKATAGLYYPQVGERGTDIEKVKEDFSGKESGVGGEDPKKKVDPPKDYAPLSPIQRKNWNDFLDYLQKEGVGGSADLDKRDQTIGLKYLNKYNKENPDKSVDQSMIPFVQYEQYMLRKGDAFPGLKPEELNYVRHGLNPAYMARPISDVDSWLGSLTSRQYYPTARRGTSAGDQYDFGVDVESYVKSLGDPVLAEKYKVKKQ